MRERRRAGGSAAVAPDGQVASIGGLITGALLRQRAQPFGGTHREVVLYARMRDRPRDAAALLRRLMAPGGADVAMVSLPGPLWPLYYGVKPLRIAARPLRPGGARGAWMTRSSALPRPHDPVAAEPALPAPHLPPSQLLGVVRLYVGVLLETMPWRVALVVALMVCAGLTEGLGLVLLSSLLALVGIDASQGSTGRISDAVEAALALVGLRPVLETMLLIYMAVAVSLAVLNQAQTGAGQDLVRRFTVYLRQRVYRALAVTPWTFFARQRTADLTQSLTVDVERAGTATLLLVQTAAVAVVALVYLIFAFRLSPAITLVVLGCAGVVLLLLRSSMRRARASGAAVTSVMGRLYAATLEHLGAMKIARSYGAQDRMTALYADVAVSISGLQADAARDRARAKMWFDIGSMVLLVTVLYVALERARLPTADLLLLLFVFARLMPRISAVQQSGQQFLQLLPAFEAVESVARRCEAVVETPAAAAASVPAHQQIALEGVSFSYGGAADAAVIRDLSLVIPVGATVAVVGPSGAGKTTVADLVAGLIAPDRGRVLVDGVALDGETLAGWRAQIGYVSQETFLFHDTVRANLLWAAPAADDDQLWEALRLAAADQFVARLPEGLETVVGERGVRLSGGERARIALARALLRRPAVLILDEATSNLDPENEQRVLDAINALHGRITVLMITHRLATVRCADLIHVLEDGRLVESGSWERLVALPGGRFRTLAGGVR